MTRKLSEVNVTDKYIYIRGGASTIDEALQNLEDVLAERRTDIDWYSVEPFYGLHVVYDPQEQRWHAIQCVRLMNWTPKQKDETE